MYFLLSFVISVFLAFVISSVRSFVHYGCIVFFPSFVRPSVLSFVRYLFRSVVIYFPRFLFFRFVARSLFDHPFFVSFFFNLR